MKGPMKLLDPYTGLMECTVCSARHTASIKPMSGGQFYRGSWQCKNGCNNQTKLNAAWRRERPLEEVR